jgi:hypothetical protein
MDLTMNALDTHVDAGRFVAWLDAEAGLPPARCYVADVSRSGAKVKVFRPQVPNEFTLHFTRKGDAKVRCRVKARAGSNVDVEFVASLSIYG